ncbi:MAG: hypothetical protein ACRD68_01865, partial [Pyrinomonadaceae bacterium]
LSEGDSPGDLRTERGHVLIFGGDQVYPVASRKEYRERLLVPYKSALECTGPPPGEAREDDPHPWVFATPGNHDWYDSLVSFTRLFCAGRWFAGWLTQQSRSYYALRLPGRWWLLGIDVQLGSDLDGAQVRFFERVAKEMGEDDRVILCTAEPHWVLADLYKEFDEEYSESNLKFFEEKVLGDRAQVFVYLAGDLHHYRRHEYRDRDGTTIQKITAGGGGAFLHPTHNMGRVNKSEEGIETKEGTRRGKETIRDSMLTREEKAARKNISAGGAGANCGAAVAGGKTAGRVFTLEACFPGQDASRRAGLGNLAFVWHNRKFGLITGALYWLSSWVVVGYVSEFDRGNAGGRLPFWENLFRTARLEFPDAALAFWLAVIMSGFVLFTESHSKLYRWAAGIVHGLAHVLAVGALSVVAYYVALRSGLDPTPDPRQGGALLSLLVMFGTHLLIAAFIFFGGWVVGSFIMGVYLWASFNLFGRHYNEAFSALKIEDWKHFLRLRIDAEGNLEIYPIGIPKVPRRWREAKGADAAAHATAKFVPGNTSGEDGGIELILIEPPVRLPSPDGQFRESATPVRPGDATEEPHA